MAYFPAHQPNERPIGRFVSAVVAAPVLTGCNARTQSIHSMSRPGLGPFWADGQASARSFPALRVPHGWLARGLRRDDDSDRRELLVGWGGSKRRPPTGSPRP
jgi:hypothetical protein